MKEVYCKRVKDGKVLEEWIEKDDHYEAKQWNNCFSWANNEREFAYKQNKKLRKAQKESRPNRALFNLIKSKNKKLRKAIKMAKTIEERENAMRALDEYNEYCAKEFFDEKGNLK